MNGGRRVRGPEDKKLRRGNPAEWETVSGCVPEEPARTPGARVFKTSW